MIGLRSVKCSVYLLDVLPVDEDATEREEQALDVSNSPFGRKRDVKDVVAVRFQVLPGQVHVRDVVGHHLEAMRGI